MKLEDAIELCEKNFLIPKTDMSLSEFWKYQNRTAQIDATMPLAYVRKDGRISFNEVAKNFEFIEEIKEILTTVWKDDHEERIFGLTSSIKELAEIAPKLKTVGLGISVVKDMR